MHRSFVVPFRESGIDMAKPMANNSLMISSKIVAIEAKLRRDSRHVTYNIGSRASSEAAYRFRKTGNKTPILTDICDAKCEKSGVCSLLLGALKPKSEAQKNEKARK
jgi:hypothetical protein